jgi:hypothetical protein
VAKLVKLPIDTSDLLDLTPLQTKFIGLYCVEDFDPVSAYKKTYGLRCKDLTETEIRLASMELLNQRSISIAVARFKEQVLAPYRDVIETQILAVLQARAFSKPTDFFNTDGSAKRLDQIDQGKLHAIESITTDFKGKDAQIKVVQYKIADKSMAIKQLVELLKKDDGPEEISNVSDEARKRVSDIMTGAKFGAKMAKDLLKQNEPEKKAEATKAEYEEAEDAELAQMDADGDSFEAIEAPEVPIDLDPVVQQAKKIVAQNNAGFVPEGHELIAQAREAVAIKRELASQESREKVRDFFKR